MLAMCHMEPVKVKTFYFCQVDLIITNKEKQFNMEKLLSARPEIAPTGSHGSCRALPQTNLRKSQQTHFMVATKSSVLSV